MVHSEVHLLRDVRQAGCPISTFSIEIKPLITQFDGDRHSFSQEFISAPDSHNLQLTSVSPPANRATVYTVRQSVGTVAFCVEMADV